MSDAAIVSVRTPRRLLRLIGDDRLVRLAAAGDRDAFAVIYSRYHQAIYRYCRSLVRNHEDAADALQSTMIRALAALEGESRTVTLKPWLYRIAHNEAMSLLRRRRPQDNLLDGEMFGGPPLDVTAETRERMRELASDLAELSERRRAALLMRELGGLSHAEVAAALDVSVDAAKQTVFEARAALHEMAEGREMSCDVIRQAISDRDGRVLRGRRLRAHLRDCAGCRDFLAQMRSRRTGLEAIAPPLPPAAATALLEGLLGGGPSGSAGAGTAADSLIGSGSAAGGSGPVAGGVAASLPAGGAAGGVAAVGGAAGTGKLIAAVAAAVTLGAGTAGVVSVGSDGSAERGTAQPRSAERAPDGAPPTTHVQPSANAHVERRARRVRRATEGSDGGSRRDADPTALRAPDPAGVRPPDESERPGPGQPVTAPPAASAPYGADERPASPVVVPSDPAGGPDSAPQSLPDGYPQASPEQSTSADTWTDAPTATVEAPSAPSRPERSAPTIDLPR